MITHSYSSDLVNIKENVCNEKSVILFKPVMSKTVNLFRRLLSGALNPLLTRYQIRREIIYLFGFITSFVVIPCLLTIVSIVLNKFSQMFFISSVYFWLCLLTKSQLTSNKLYLILSINFLSEFINNSLNEIFLTNNNNFWINYCLFETNIELTSFIICVSIIVWFLYFFGFSFGFGSVVVIITQMCRILLSTCNILSASPSLRPFVTLVLSLIGIIGARTTESALSPVISCLMSGMSGESRVVAWRRRRSSNATFAVPRRTSLPTLSSGNRALGCHGNHVSHQLLYLLFPNNLSKFYQKLLQKHFICLTFE